MTHNADLKSPLIDLEAEKSVTGGKQERGSVQPERPSEENNMYSLYWIRLQAHTNVFHEGYIGITCNLKERMKAHKKCKKRTVLVSKIKSHGWESLIKEELLSSLTLSEALSLEAFYRPTPFIGWNILKGGLVGVGKNWYTNETNKNRHSKETSKGTIKGIQLKDSKEKRSIRAKNGRSKNSRLNIGSTNGKAILNEEQVYKIKFDLIPNGMSDKDIAALFNVKPYVIYFVRINKTWKHVICDGPSYNKQA